ncbi:MAG: 5'/3'-nucleotidase SurE [Fidelibacterota bacterium]|nr:MAG: 5'/3'-nucleotidase SurE [Candidatus Neomarinimicrobiota bacterium]
MSAPLILISNDDGIQAAGLRALCEAMLPLGEVVVMAPEVERSAAGHAITLSDPLRVNEVDLGLSGVTAYACSGTPADCVKLAVLSVLPRRPSLVVSGINHGSNTGINVIYSGTISAATEGTILGIPSAAFSVARWTNPEFGPAKAISYQVAQRILVQGLPEGTLLNVNIPDLPAEELPVGSLEGRGYALTVHGKADWQDRFDRRVDPQERVYYWLAGRKRERQEPPNTDEETLKAGKVSITPLHYDLTHHSYLTDLAKWDLFRTN